MDYYNQYYYLHDKNNTEYPKKVSTTHVIYKEDIHPAHVTVWMAWLNHMGPIVVQLFNLLSTTESVGTSIRAMKSFSFHKLRKSP